MLSQIGRHSPPEGLVVRSTCCRQLILTQCQLTACGEGIALKFVSRLVFRVIALQRERKRDSRRILRRKLQLDFVRILRLWTQLERFGLRVAIVISYVGQAERGKGKEHLRLFLRPVEEVRS